MPSFNNGRVNQNIFESLVLCTESINSIEGIVLSAGPAKNTPTWWVSVLVLGTELNQNSKHTRSSIRI